MRVVDEPNVTAVPRPDPAEARAAGVWTLAGNELIIAEPDGPATILVPTEQVRLLGVDLPLASRGKRLEALPFAVEERIAEPLESVHLALGAEIGSKRYLVGVVRHDIMADWIARADAAGLGHAAMVPDALALPLPPEGVWAVDLEGDRAVVRAGDGTGFALPAAMLRPAWEAAGRPPGIAHGAPLPAEMLLESAALDSPTLARRLSAPALDLRQGPYARRRSAMPNVWRRVAWIVALGAAAHAVIALADTVMLRVIADRRAEETRQLVALAAPGTNLSGDVATTVANLLPQGG
jgi:general secretion pathway protein L